MKKVKIGIIGIGTVGSGVVKLLNDNKQVIKERTNCQIEISSILVKDINKKRDINSIYNDIITDNEEELFKNLDVLVELMGTIEKAKYYISKALSSGIHVVTANKDLIAKHGVELLELAKNNKVRLLFDSAVCGSIPIIDMIQNSFQGNNIKSILGILNGTTNYILTLMEKENVTFEKALLEAKALGYAESDPTNDIKGYDAARKIAILASIAFNTEVPIEKVHVEGITKINIKDIMYAKELGYRIKLLGMAKEKEGLLKVQVNPVFIPLSHPLANINDVYNGVYLEGDFLGPSMVYGHGAGSYPTASSVVGDIIKIINAIDNNTFNAVSIFRKLEIKSVLKSHSSFYIRIIAKDQSGVLASIASIFGSHDVSIYSVVQKQNNEGLAEIVLITHEGLEANIYDAITVLKSLNIINTIDSVIRVEDNNNGI